MSVLKLFGLIFPLLSANSAVSENTYVLCKNQKVVRTLRIDREKGLCKTVYTKDGNDQIIGSGMNVNSCQKFLDDVKKNLIASNWKCRDVKESKVSQVQDEK